MENKYNNCAECDKLVQYINKQMLIAESAFDLALDVSEFIKNCECEEKEDEFEEPGKQYMA